ncbi:MAG: DUF4838 domain-containing protein [Verrucomicrobiae bacterium]|nr:DUF4838 domain-containing protein [Verrucomicrobiae bacterium]
MVFQIFLALLFALAGAPFVAASEAFFLARDGAPPASVILLPGSGAPAEDAARDLRRVLGIMSGRAPEIADAPQREPAVVVGLASEWARATGEEGPAARLANAASESFLLLSSAKRLLVLGKDAAGVSHGVYTLLHDLGCRWFFLGRDWEVIPKKSEIEVRADRVEGPAFRVRRLNCGASQGGASRALFEEWSRRNRLGSAYGKTGIHHAYANFVPESLFKEHPEYFAWVSADGKSPGNKQNGLQPCTTHPEVVKRFTEGALSILRGRRERDPDPPLLLSVSPNDNTGNLCRCERCRAVGSYTDCALLLANQVAEAIRGEFPRTLVGFMAYGRVSPAPSAGREADPNVIVSMATAYTWNTHPLEMQLQWPKFVRHLIVREYYSIGQWGGARPDYEGPAIADLSQTLKRWRAQGLEGVEAEMNHFWGSCGARFWAAARFLWMPDLPREEVSDDFYTNCWGTAAVPMRRYFERWESGQPASARVMGLAFQDLADAARLAADPAVRRRVDLLTLYLHGFHLQEQTAKIAEECRRMKLSEEETQRRLEPWCEEGNQLLYRGKDAYLVAISPKAYRMTRPHPPFTPAEAENLRARDLDFYRKAVGGALVEVGGAPVSMDLMPPRARERAAPSATSASPEFLLGKTSYLMRLKANEELTMSLEKPREIEAPASIRTPKEARGEGEDLLESARGERLGRIIVWSLGSEGRDRDFLAFHSVTSENAARPIRFVAPREGLYQFDVASGAREKSVIFRVVGPPSRSMFADLKNHQNISPLEIRPPARAKGARRAPSPTTLYFYVPKGTTRFALQLRRFKNAPVDFTLSARGGQVIHEERATRDSEWIIPVPTERSDAVWKLWIGTDQISRVGLDGVPPCVAVDPSDLLVPRAATAAP